MCVCVFLGFLLCFVWFGVVVWLGGLFRFSVFCGFFRMKPPNKLVTNLVIMQHYWKMQECVSFYSYSRITMMHDTLTITLAGKGGVGLKTKEALHLLL